MSHVGVCSRNLVCSAITPEQITKRNVNLFSAGLLCINESLCFFTPLFKGLSIHDGRVLSLACGAVLGWLWRFVGKRDESLWRCLLDDLHKPNTAHIFCFTCNCDLTKSFRATLLGESLPDHSCGSWKHKHRLYLPYSVGSL